MVTSTAPSAWRAISPVSRVTWWRPREKVFLMDFTGVFLLSGGAGAARLGVARPARGWEGPKETKSPARSVRRRRGAGSGVGSLLAQAEALDQRAIGLDVLALQVVEQAAAPAHHGEQAAAGMEILDVRLEVLGKHVDALGEERDLDLGRTRVGLRALVIGDDARLVCGGDSHGFNSPTLSGFSASRETAILARIRPQTQAKSGSFLQGLARHEAQWRQPRARARSHPEEAALGPENRHHGRALQPRGRDFLASAEAQRLGSPAFAARKALDQHFHRQKPRAAGGGTGGLEPLEGCRIFELEGAHGGAP